MESAKLTLGNVMQITKKSFNAEKNKKDTKLSTDYWRLATKKLHSPPDILEFKMRVLIIQAQFKKM